MVSDTSRGLSTNLKGKKQTRTNNLRVFRLWSIILIKIMEFTEAERKEAKHFGEFYIDMMENYRNTVKYYLSKMSY
ncbi:hypothetical protein NQ317_006068 [Molorchus minor]|uniref:Uncharacterized protein n=1 Tax=Molorchus minor TaxID=1323400 RepID=A0ABQ9K223_9CUCU|nr:hypothetical protein NQ317_006068 [Molorchus minor]